MKKIKYDKDDFCCENMFNNIYSEDVVIVYIPRFREYGIRILDGGSSKIKIEYCPWCGKTLPKSLAEEWFAHLKKMGIEDSRSKHLPREYRSDAWWKKLEL